MLKKIKLIGIRFGGAIMLLVSVAAFTPGLVAASGTNLSESDINGQICSGIKGSDTTNTTTTNTAPCNNNGSNGITSILRIVINIMSFVVGAVSVIMIIIGGLRYVTSGGNDQSIAGAKNTIIFALIGLVIVALAQIIVEFVFAKANQAANA